MKKKIVIALLMGALCVSVTACGKEEPQRPVSYSDTIIEAEQPEEAVSETEIKSETEDVSSSENTNFTEEVTLIEEEPAVSPDEAEPETAVAEAETDLADTSIASSVQQMLDDGLIDEDGNVTPTEDNNVLPEDINPEDYMVEGTDDMVQESKDGSIDFDSLQVLLSEIASYAQGDAGSSLKAAVVVKDVLHFANNMDASALGDSIISPAIMSVFDQMMGFETEAIAENAGFLRQMGDAAFAESETAVASFESANVWSEMKQEIERVNAKANWDAFWDAVTGATAVVV